MGSNERRKVIAKVRQEGYDAYLAGKSRHSIPQEHRGNMNQGHWIAGWEMANHFHELVIGEEQAEETRREEAERDSKLEISHVAQWIELSNRAKNFGYRLGISDEGFDINRIDDGTPPRSRYPYAIRCSRPHQ